MIIHFFEISVEPGHDPDWKTYDGEISVADDQRGPVEKPGIGVGHVDCGGCGEKRMYLSMIDQATSIGIDVALSTDVAETIALDMLRRVAILRGTPAS